MNSTSGFTYSPQTCGTDAPVEIKDNFEETDLSKYDLYSKITLDIFKTIVVSDYLTEEKLRTSFFALYYPVYYSKNCGIPVTRSINLSYDDLNLNLKQKEIDEIESDEWFIGWLVPKKEIITKKRFLDTSDKSADKQNSKIKNFFSKILELDTYS